MTSTHVREGAAVLAEVTAHVVCSMVLAWQVSIIDRAFEEGWIVPRPPRKRTVLPHPRGGLALQSGFSAGAHTRASAHACMHACMHADAARAPHAEGALVASRGHRIANKQTNKQPIRSLRVAELSGADKEQPKPSEAVAAWAKRPSDCLTVSTG